jgi:hypothetical protein
MEPTLDIDPIFTHTTLKKYTYFHSYTFGHP